MTLELVLHMKSGKTHNVTTTEFASVVDFAIAISNAKEEWTFFVNEGVGVRHGEIEGYNVREERIKLGKK